MAKALGAVSEDFAGLVVSTFLDQTGGITDTRVVELPLGLVAHAALQQGESADRNDQEEQRRGGDLAETCNAAVAASL